MAIILPKIPKIAIFDLTDCEGCELEFINLREKLTSLLGQVEFANWRMASDNHDIGPFDLTFIEGSPITPNDIETVKQARAASRLVVTLGTCAEFGGVQAVLSPKEWESGLKEVYGGDYKTPNRAPKPVSYYIDVDIHLPGCPVNINELERFLAAILNGKKPEVARYPVCLECKAKENSCLLLEGQPCLGPVTKGGCNAVCPERGLRCWGCFGALPGGNQKALNKLFTEKYGEIRARQLLEIFYSSQDEFKEIYPLQKPVNKEKKRVRIST